MSTYKQVSYGSQGDDVKTLQEMLNQKGYSLDTDGIFGSKTQSAVKDYQSKNSLTADGIVGSNTWNSLTSAASGSKSDTAAGSATANTGYQYTDYAESDTVAQARQLLEQKQAQALGTYSSDWQTQLSDTLNKILNREEFSYDLNGDALYQQYKDQYTTQGKLAMMDAMGQAQTMTGGYGNSYAQSVGQQTYQNYLQQLNDQVPELYQLALSKYQSEEDALYDQAALLAQQEALDYSRYRDQVSDYNTELERLQDQYYTERDYDYSRWADARDFGYTTYSDEWERAYQQKRDAVSDAQWQAEFDEAKRQYDLSYASAASSGSGVETEAGEPQSGFNILTYAKNKSANGGSYSSQVMEDLQVMKKAGMTNEEAKEFLQELMENSLITPTEYLTLYAKYQNKM